MDAALTREILKKVRQIELRTRRLVTDALAGEYHSVFKGRGMDFDEVREYSPGDEVRLIDWNVTARTGVPFIKKLREERELTLLLAVDVSAVPRESAIWRRGYRAFGLRTIVAARSSCSISAKCSAAEAVPPSTRTATGRRLVPSRYS